MNLFSRFTAIAWRLACAAALAGGASLASGAQKPLNPLNSRLTFSPQDLHQKPPITRLGVKDPRYANTIERMSKIITNLMTVNDVASLSIALVDSNRVVWSQGFGLADRENDLAATEETIYMIGSVSKTFAAVALMQLVEQGRVGLDTPVTNYLPGWSQRQRFTPQPQVTVRHLLAHLSGLPGDYNNGASPVRPALVSDEMRTLAVLTNDYPSMPANFVPVYCNNGWEVAERIVEVVSGAPFYEYARTNMFVPMGMASSSFRHDALLLGQRMAHPYYLGHRLPDEYIIAEGAGGMTSTVDDLAQFLITLLGEGLTPTGQRLLQAATIRDMYQPQTGNNTLSFQYTSLFSRQLPVLGFRPGLGWDTVNCEQFAFAGRYASKGGDSTTQHSAICLLPDAGLGVALALSGQGITQEELADTCLHYAALDKLGCYGPTNLLAPDFSPVVSWPADALVGLTGHYATESGCDVITADPANGTLTWTVNVQSSSPQTIAGLVPRANGWFSSPTSQVVELCFTNVLDQTCLVRREVFTNYHREWLYGQRFTPQPLSSVWSNRVGDYIAINTAPGDYTMQIGVATTGKLRIRENVVYLDDIVYHPVNERLAFTPFFGLRSSPTLEFDLADDSVVVHGDVRLQRVDSFPVLKPGGTTNGSLTGNQNLWFRVPVAKETAYTVDLDTTGSLRAWVYSQTGIGAASPAHAFQFVPDSDGEYLVGVMGDDSGSGSFRLAIHTNNVPFYKTVPAADWPADLITYSNRYGNLEFGYAFVPEKRPNDTGNLLKIAVATMKSPNPSAQPLLFCNGGPGASAIRDYYQYCLKPLVSDYDVYLIDQRGVGYSQPSMNPRGAETLKELQYRLSMLQSADLSTVNTLESSYDIEDVHAAIGLGKANLMGLSYGTLLSQTVMRRNPSWLRSVILDGVLPPNITPVSQTGPVLYQALENLFHDIAADPGAAAFYPDFRHTFYTLTTNLQEHPAMIDAYGTMVRVDGLMFLQAVVSQMCASDFGIRERIPSLVFRASAGETSALLDLCVDYNLDWSVLIAPVHGDLMERLVLKHDILAFDSMETVYKVTANLPGVLRQYCIAFAQDDHFDFVKDLEAYGSADASFALPVTSSIPTLVINGTYDMRTGTDWAAEVASHLSNSHLVIVPTVGHGVLFSQGCTIQVLRNFLADPGQDPTPDCLSHLSLAFPAPWPAATPPLVSGQSVTNLDLEAGDGAWYSFSAGRDLYYDFHVDFASGKGWVLDATGKRVGQVGPGSSRWRAPADGQYYLWLIAGGSGTAQFTWQYPLLIHELRLEPEKQVLTWQGEPGQAFDVWGATDLAGEHPFVRVGSVAASGESLRHYTNDLSGGVHFYRVSSAASR